MTLTLPILRKEIAHRTGVAVHDPNSLTILCCQNTNLSLLEPIKEVTSVLSHGAAVIYRSDNLQIPLTPDELWRLIMCRLYPSEMLRLKSRYGVFFEIHEDFYDMDTGEALQPKG